MKLSFVLNEAGFTAENLDTAARITFEDGAITNIHLDLTASISGLDNDKFQELALNAKQNCPISGLLKTEITLNAKLV